MKSRVGGRNRIANNFTNDTCRREVLTKVNFSSRETLRQRYDRVTTLKNFLFISTTRIFLLTIQFTKLLSVKYIIYANKLFLFFPCFIKRQLYHRPHVDPAKRDVLHIKRYQLFSSSNKSSVSGSSVSK